MSWDNKKILVTGGAGVIGRELIKQLVGKNCTVLCIDREPKPSDLPTNIQYCQEDISEMDLGVVKAFNPEIIFHLAASFERLVETPEFWDINFRDNIVVSHRIIDVAKDCPDLKKFVFASSYLIYSDNLYLFDKPASSARLLNEDDPLETRNLTGAAKYYAEQELKYMKEVYNSFTTISARIYRVYGCGSRDVISRWVRMALNGEELQIYQPENMFDYIYAGDVAEGLIRSAETINKDVIVNLGSGRTRRISEVIDLLKSHFPKLSQKNINEGERFEASCADMAKYKQLMNWQPPIMIEEGIERIVAYEREALSMAR